MAEKISKDPGSRTANDFKFVGGFLPVFDDAEAAPLEPHCEAPFDDHPWTKADDVRLKKELAGFKTVPDKQKPWPLIATKCDFGHNSGSCRDRWVFLQEQQTQDKYHNVKAISFGANGGPITGKVGKYTTIAISS